MSRVSAIICGGVAVGWLIGLSQSPVVQVVITSIIGALVAGASALSDTREFRFQLALWPVAAVAVCIALTAPLGIIARERGWFGPEQEKTTIIKQWKDRSEVLTKQHEYWTGQGLDAEFVSQVMFGAEVNRLPLQEPSFKDSVQSQSSGLYASHKFICAGLESTTSLDELRPLLKQSTSAILRALAEVEEEDHLRDAISEFCE